MPMRSTEPVNFLCASVMYWTTWGEWRREHTTKDEGGGNATLGSIRILNKYGCESHFHQRFANTIFSFPIIGDRCKVFCLQNNMILVIPKPLLRGADREHIRALDLNCKASENQTHFVLDVPLTSCGTNSRHSLSSVIYSNEALPAPPSARELVSHVPNFEIPFYCYYDNSGVVTGVGLRPESKKVIFSQKGFGKFSLSLELYPDERFEAILFLTIVLV